MDATLWAAHGIVEALGAERAAGKRRRTIEHTAKEAWEAAALHGFLYGPGAVRVAGPDGTVTDFDVTDGARE